MTLEELVVDPEFEKILPPLTEDEFNGLEEDIVHDGELNNPIILWGNTIIDGHNRYHILQKHPEIALKTMQKKFSDRWEVLDWIYKNQLNRRNLTENQRNYLVGKRYTAQKNTQGGQTGNQNASKRTGQNDLFVSRREQRDGAAGVIGKEYGMSPRTVRRNEEFAIGIDEIRKEDPELANDILEAKKIVTKNEVRDIASAPAEKKHDMITELKRDKPRLVKSKAERDADRELREKVSQSISEVRNGSSYEVTIDDLIELFQEAANTTIYSLRSIINSRKELVTNNKTKVIESIDKIFTEMINEIKEII